MKKKQAERLLTRYVLPHLPNWVVHGAMIIMRPLEHLYCAFYLEGSSYDATSFYLESMIMPLYWPADEIGGNIGERLDRKGDPWELVPPDQELKLGKDLWDHVRAGLQWMEQFATVEKLCQNYEQAGSLDNTHILEAIAGAAILCDKPSLANQMLDRMIDILTEDPDTELVDWCAEQLARARLLRNFIERDDIESAKKQLAKWERHTIKACKLDALK